MQVVTNTIVNPVPPSGTFENLTTTITSNPSVGFPVTAYGYCCLSANAASCPTNANSPLFVKCTSTGTVYVVPDLLAYKNQGPAEVGLGMSVSNGGPPSLNSNNDYEIGARRCMGGRLDVTTSGGDARLLRAPQTRTTLCPSASALCCPAR